MDVVGDDEEPLMAREMPRNLFGSRADIDIKRAVVRDDLSGPGADPSLLLLSQMPTRLIRHILDSRRHHGPAMGAGQQPLLTEFIKVFADGLWRYAKTVC